MDISEPGRFNKKTTSTQSNTINQESPWLSARATQNVSEYQKAKPRRGTAPMTTRRLNLIHVTSCPDFEFSFWGDEYCWTPLLVEIKFNQLGWFNAWPWDEMSHGSWCSWRRVSWFQKHSALGMSCREMVESSGGTCQVVWSGGICLNSFLVTRHTIDFVDRKLLSNSILNNWIKWQKHMFFSISDKAILRDELDLAVGI